MTGLYCKFKNFSTLSFYMYTISFMSVERLGFAKVSYSIYHCTKNCGEITGY